MEEDEPIFFPVVEEVVESSISERENLHKTPLSYVSVWSLVKSLAAAKFESFETSVLTLGIFIPNSIGL